MTTEKQLRDEFAMSVAGSLSQHPQFRSFDRYPDAMRWLAEKSYQAADAMLAEREKEPTK